MHPDSNHGVRKKSGLERHLQSSSVRLQQGAKLTHATATPQHLTQLFQSRVGRLVVGSVFATFFYSASTGLPTVRRWVRELLLRPRSPILMPPQRVLDYHNVPRLSSMIRIQAPIVREE